MAALALQNTWSWEKRDIQHSLYAVAEAADSIDTRTFELASGPRVRTVLVPALRAVMDDAIVVLGHVLARYDAPQVIEGPDDSGVFNCRFDEMVVDAHPTRSHQRIADISFMARWEIERKLAAIAEAVRGDDQRLIAECCSARRRVVKAASGVERVLSEVEGLPSVFESLFQTERQRAVDTRSAYCTFALGVRTATILWQDYDLERCFRSIAARIAQLVGRPIYEDLRIEDRRSLRSLQARLVEWLGGARDPLAARRLISEIAAFTALLMEVNQRPVLIEHDCEVLDELIAVLAQPASKKAAFYRLLATLRGREPELDALIERQADLRPELWHDIAQRTLARLRQVANSESI